MPEKIPCIQCEVLILPNTAEKTGGLCMPCKNGIRENIERSKEYYQTERELDKTCPFRKFWRDTVAKVFDENKGFNSLSDAEKSYYAVTCLSGEVYNGGFIQYFDNSAGEHCKYAELGLMQLGATHSLQLLRQARRIAFDGKEIPVKREIRRAVTDNEAINASLDKLDDEFYKDKDNLGDKLEKFALSSGLVKNT